MRRALRGTSIRGRGQLPQPVFEVQYMPPPVGGLNQRDSVPLMDERDAIDLTNWIADTNHVRMRAGHDEHAVIAVGTAASVETLIPYHPPNIANGKLFAAVGSRIVDVTAETTATALDAVVTGLTNSRFQYDTLTNSAGSFLFVCNGANDPRTYNGTTWSVASVSATGLTISNIIGVRNHINRLWFIEENSLIPWYLESNAISGSLEQFIVPFRKAGKLMAIASWSVDGGGGSDDLIVFISSHGEAVLYSGIDPSSINTWALVGRFDIPDVIGRRCVVNAGSDLGVLTVQGLVPLSQVIRGAVGSASRVAFTDKISGFFRQQFPISGGLFGWECIEFPRGNLVIINVPLISGSEFDQAVCNVNTGSWSKFTDLNASCWGLLNDELYFGGNMAVYRYDLGLNSDNGEPIIATMQTAYTALGGPRTKRFTSARPLFLAPLTYEPTVSIQTDYETASPPQPVTAGRGGTQWHEDPYVVGAVGQWAPGPLEFQWAGGTEPVVRWQDVAGIGRAVSVSFAISSEEELIYNGCDIGYETGNYL